MPWTRQQFEELIARTTVNIGSCQCIDDRAAIRAACVPDRAACEATCGRQYSLIPAAPEKCGEAGE